MVNCKKLVDKNVPSWDFENQSNYSNVIGVDEAGVGPWCGPVVAAAAIFYNKNVEVTNLVKDSKLLSPQKRALIFNQLLNTDGFYYGMGSSNVIEIDNFNILRANHLAMNRAISQLRRKLSITKATILVDGCFAPTFNSIAENEVISIIKGDQKSFTIAAASIIAKVCRDELMQHLHKAYPNYGWQKNAGYGTKEHQLKLHEHGVCPHHRTSFKPIKKLRCHLKNESK